MDVQGKIISKVNGKKTGVENFVKRLSENKKYIYIDVDKTRKNTKYNYKHIFTADNSLVSLDFNANYATSKTDNFFSINLKVTPCTCNNVKKLKLTGVMIGPGVGTIKQEIFLPSNTRFISHPLSVDAMLFIDHKHNKQWKEYPCYYMSNQGHVGNIGILMKNKIRYVGNKTLPFFPNKKLSHYQIQCNLEWEIDEPICDFYIDEENVLVYYSHIIYNGAVLEFKITNLQKI